MTTWRKLAALLAATLLTIGLAACGDDDDDDTAVGADDTSEETEAEGEEGDHDEEMDEAMEGNPCAPDAPDDALPPAEEPADGATAITVTAKDYSFEGAEALEAGGSFAITLENEGTELHEMVVQIIDPSETRTIEEMMQSEEPPDTVTPVGFGIACPGESTVFNADVTEPGRYVALCFVPVGTTPEATSEPEGPPHAAQGMILEFEVG